MSFDGFKGVPARGLPPLSDAALAAAIAALPPRKTVQRRPRKAPPSLRQTTLDPLQVDVLAALVATLPGSVGNSPGPALTLISGGKPNG